MARNSIKNFTSQKNIDIKIRVNVWKKVFLHRIKTVSRLYIHESRQFVLSHDHNWLTRFFKVAVFCDEQHTTKISALS